MCYRSFTFPEVQLDTDFPHLVLVYKAQGRDPMQYVAKEKSHQLDAYHCERATSFNPFLHTI